jgi:hypothetical protein
MKKISLLILISITLVGCSTQKFIVNGKVGDTIVASNSSDNTFYVSGIGQTREIDAAGVCGSPDKVLAVQAQQSFLNIFFGFITLGIYTPRDYSVYCKK